MMRAIFERLGPELPECEPNNVARILVSAPLLARLLLLLLAAAPGLSQDEAEPYFSISSNRTFASNSRTAVELSAAHLDSLEFRIYRVHDPVKFFEQIEDPHQFGGRVPAPSREPTLLERIHSWKRSLRANIRRSLRAQFSESPSEHLVNALPHQPAKPGDRGTYYAETPLLNSQQLVHSFVQPVEGHSRWDRETVELGIKEKGVYLVEAVRHDLRAYTILVVTDVVMITKTGKGRIVNLMVDRATGEPIQDAQLWMLRKDGHRQVSVTNPEGIGELKMDEERPDDVRIVGRRGADFAINSLSSYAFGVNIDEWKGYAYTDRPVYRPGHTVHFNAIVRRRTGSGYEVPAGAELQVEIQDSDQKPVYSKTLTVSANGSLHGDLVLSPTATLGYYSLQVKDAAVLLSANFEVQEYKKPEYEVRVLPAKSRVIQGETVQTTIDSRYYFGEPVNGAKVEYAVYRERYWLPIWYDPDDSYAPPQNPDDNESNGDQVAQGDGQLDGDGKLNINVETAVSDRKFDYIYRVEARVTDQANREISGKGWVVASYGSFAVNVSPDRYFYQPGSKAELTVDARDYDNKPVATRAHVEVSEWYWRDTSKHPVKASTDVDTGPNGSAPGEINLPAEGGSYRVRVTAHTPEGRDVEADSYLWVSGGSRWESDFESRPNKDIQIIPDKKTYQAGDTAKLLIVTGKSNTPVYVTMEGRDLKQLKLIRSTDSTASFEVPVTAADEPGIRVAAAFIRKGNLYKGEKNLRVPAVSHQLNVRLATDKPQYLPGQTAEYSVDVTGSDGQPVPHAEFSLGVVDEAIYGIRKDTTEDILGFFFGYVGNSVFTEDSLQYYFNGEAGHRRMRLTELRPLGRLAQLKPDRLVMPKIRKAFPDTAFWSTDVVTDGAGHARAKVDFPDSLTTWRATARGATPETKVGNATLKTIVRKNLILRLAVPRFFVQGDEVVVSALVHNYLADAKTVRVSLDVTGLEVIDGATKDVRVPSKGEVKVDWRVRAKQVRSASVLGKALTDEESDALQLDLPVNVPGVKLSQSRGGTLNGGNSAAYDLTFPDKIEPGSRSLSIRLSPSVAGSLFGALEYLTSFPYGCVEQTMSGFLPDIIVMKVVNDLGLKTTLDQASLQEKIHAGLDRLYSFQHEDGGWGWWQTDDTHPFMTAYVVAGLSQAQAAGAKVNPEVIQKGVAWVQKDFAKDTRLAADLGAYMQYSLAVAGQPDTKGLGQIYEQRSKLSPYGLALLGLALEQTKDTRAGEVAASLESSAKQDQLQAWWPATRDEMLDFSADVTPEATAYAVKFLSHQRPGSPLLPKAAIWLMEHRNEGYWWSSTKQTAMVIYGLTDYLKATNELNPNLNVTVTVNDTPAVTRKLDSATDLAAPEVILDETRLQPGVNRIRITTSGQGRLYYSTRADYYSTDDKLQKTGTVSLNLLRDYYKLVPGKDGEKIVYDTVELTGPASPGDIIAVRLTATGSPSNYVMIEDPIPAGTEFIERDSVYELRNKPPWWQYYFSRRELHDDRMAIFQTHFPQGQQQYFYLLKVVNPGIFKVSPARIGPMYQTDIFATTESRRLEVK
ncbi:MAG TPA: MG2 domain-containing protein [Bryobacteraceae bacterium]|nr:MG2 domain-containing protein [Bryobacteraceae bacterium]